MPCGNIPIILPARNRATHGHAASSASPFMAAIFLSHGCMPGKYQILTKPSALHGQSDFFGMFDGREQLSFRLLYTKVKPFLQQNKCKPAYIRTNVITRMEATLTFVSHHPGILKCLYICLPNKRQG